MDSGARKRRAMTTEEILKCRTQVRSHKYKGQLIRFVSETGQAWIVFADMCKVLGYKNPRHEIKYVSSENQRKIDIGLKNTLANCVNKQGMTTIAVLSGKKEAWTSLTGPT